MVSAAFTIETIQGSILFADRTGCKVEHANEIMAIPRRLEAKGNHSLLLSTVVTVHHNWLSLCDAEVTFCQIRSTIREKWSVPSLRLASAHTHQAKYLTRGGLGEVPAAEHATCRCSERISTLELACPRAHSEMFGDAHGHRLADS
jgi:hypothetical protein